MKFSVEKEAFLKPLRAVAGVIERRQGNSAPILSHVLIETEGNRFTLTGTDQEVELVAGGELCEASEDARLALPFRKLMDLCRALPEGVSLTFSKEQERIIIRAGRSRFALSTLPAEEFPKLKPATEALQISIAKQDMRHLIESTGFAMAEQDVRYYLNGMLLEVKEDKLLSVAADGHRLALCQTLLHSNVQKDESPVDRASDRTSVNSASANNPSDNSYSLSKVLRIIVPRKGVLELQRVLNEGDDAISLLIGSNYIRAITEDITLTSKLVEGRFPEYDRIIPKGGNKRVQGRREALKEAFMRAAALFSDKFRGVRLQLVPGKLKILATNVEQDEVEEDLEVDYQGTELEIGFNVRYLIDFLTVIKTDIVSFTFTDANSPALVEGVAAGNAAVYVIMPMRI